MPACREQDTAQLSFEHIFNPSSLSLILPAVSLGTCWTELSLFMHLRRLHERVWLSFEEHPSYIHFFSPIPILYIHLCHEIPVVRPKRKCLKLPLKVSDVSSFCILKMLGQCKDCFYSHVLWPDWMKCTSFCAITILVVGFPWLHADISACLALR